MTAHSIAIAAHTDIGRIRTINEDSYLVADLLPAGTLAVDGSAQPAAGRELLLALSDGMGGHAAGEVASKLTLSALLEALRTSVGGEPEARLEAAVLHANTTVHAAAATQGKEGMGATLTAILLIDSVAYVAEIGDSRAYLLRGESFVQLTRDQSLVQTLVDSGVMTAEEALHSPVKNVITQAVGTDPEVHPVISRVQLQATDALVLCSDGITNAIKDAEIAEALHAQALVAASRSLIELANARGGDDNLTVILARLGHAQEPAA